MNMPDSLASAFEAHVTSERFAEASYLSMRIAFEAAVWPGFAAWAARQAADERTHAAKFLAFLDDRNMTPVLDTLPRPQNYANNALPGPVIMAALELERAVTAQIEDLYAQALEVEDHAAAVFLQWFLTEQVESEKALVNLAIEIGRADNTGLLLIDQRLGGE